MAASNSDDSEVETDSERHRGWWFYLGYATIAAGLGIGGYLTAGTVRIVLIALAAVFALVTVWSVLFMAVIESVTHVAKRGLERYRSS